MSNIEFLEQVARKQINQADNRQIEYDRTNIIIVDTFLNELYHELYNVNGGNIDKIMELVTTEKIAPQYDNKQMYFKIKLVGILNNNNYCISALSDEFKIRYSWIVHQLLDEIKKYKKINIA